MTSYTDTTKRPWDVPRCSRRTTNSSFWLEILLSRVSNPFIFFNNNQKKSFEGQKIQCPTGKGQQDKTMLVKVTHSTRDSTMQTILYNEGELWKGKTFRFTTGIGSVTVKRHEHPMIWKSRRTSIYANRCKNLLYKTWTLNKTYRKRTKFSFVFYIKLGQVTSLSNPTGDTYGAGTAYPSGVQPRFLSGFVLLDL
jgi:hypothetical protein